MSSTFGKSVEGITVKRKLGYFILYLIAVSLLFSSIITGCSKSDNTQNTYHLEDFESAIKDKGYVYEVEEAQQDFLPTTRKRMIIINKTLDIYLFDNDQKMEKEAGFIDNDGSGYDNGSTAIKVSWVSYPHFYKKGSLIVQYIGEDEDFMADLSDILGEQFAGYSR